MIDERKEDSQHIHKHTLTHTPTSLLPDIVPHKAVTCPNIRFYHLKQRGLLGLFTNQTKRKFKHVSCHSAFIEFVLPPCGHRWDLPTISLKQCLSNSLSNSGWKPPQGPQNISEGSQINNIILLLQMKQSESSRYSFLRQT